MRVHWTETAYEAEDLREVIEGPYRVIYRIGKEQIDVLAIVHGARDLPSVTENDGLLE